MINCPYCKSKMVISSSMGESWGLCTNKYCRSTSKSFSGVDAYSKAVEYVNTRPIEDELHARIADLEQQLAEADDLIEFTRENQLMSYADFEDLEQDWDRNHKEKRLKANRDRSPGPVERTDRGQKQTISGGK